MPDITLSLLIDGKGRQGPPFTFAELEQQMVIDLPFAADTTEVLSDREGPRPLWRRNMSREQHNCLSH